MFLLLMNNILDLKKKTRRKSHSLYSHAWWGNESYVIGIYSFDLISEVAKFFFIEFNINLSKKKKKKKLDAHL